MAKLGAGFVNAEPESMSAYCAHKCLAGTRPAYHLNMRVADGAAEAAATRLKRMDEYIVMWFFVFYCYSKGGEQTERKALQSYMFFSLDIEGMV